MHRGRCAGRVRCVCRGQGDQATRGVGGDRGVGILLASVQGLPLTLQVMHVITGAWVIGWLGVAVRGGTHLPDD